MSENKEEFFTIHSTFSVSISFDVIQDWWSIIVECIDRAVRLSEKV